MAKISARGATKVATCKTVPVKDDPEYPGMEVTYVLCSDRRVLRKIKYGAGLGSSGFNVWLPRLPKDLSMDESGLRKAVAHRLADTMRMVH